jgi:NADH:ubiquinone reductase (H+-translocating)
VTRADAARGAGRHRVVIVGCGFGGLFAARALKRAPVDVTVIDRTNHHLFQPLLYQVATGILSEGEIAPAIRDVLRRHRNVRVRMAEVTTIDVGARTVTSVQRGEERTTPYDSLIVAPGTHTSYFGHDEFAQWAIGLKSIDDALEARGRIIEAFELAESEPDPDRRATLLTFAVIGAGPTGVEMAGQIIELSRRALRHNFRTIDPAAARVLLFDAGPAVLPFFGERIGAKTERNLSRLGVEVHLGAAVTGMDEDSLTIALGDGTSETFAAHTKVWAAGVTGSSLGRQLAAASGGTLDRLGRVPVQDDCTLPGHPEVFVIGDLMALGDLPGMAEVAMQSGRHAARTIVARLDGKPDTPLHYRDLGSMATISRFSGVAAIGPVRLTGFVGWVLWLVVHITFLTGFKNRVSALARWTISFVGRGRSERTITVQQVLARQAVAAREAAERAARGGQSP